MRSAVNLLYAISSAHGGAICSELNRDANPILECELDTVAEYRH
jgi:hypothetical protein